VLYETSCEVTQQFNPETEMKHLFRSFPVERTSEVAENHMARAGADQIVTSES
jgi:hypothetical protein